MSVDNTTLYLYTKIVYFFRATCFDILRSFSDPPRREIQDLLMFHCIVGSQMQWNINNSWISLLGGPEDDLISSKHVTLTKYIIFVYK